MLLEMITQGEQQLTAVVLHVSLGRNTVFTGILIVIIWCESVEIALLCTILISKVYAELTDLITQTNGKTVGRLPVCIVGMCGIISSWRININSTGSIFLVFR